MSERHCAECGNTVGGALRRGRCSRCYHRAYWHHRTYGTPLPGERARRCRADVVDTYRVLRHRGLDVTQIAARLGVTGKHLKRAVAAERSAR